MNAVLGVVLLIVAGYVVFVWFGEAFRLLFVNGYRYMRWERHGLCYKCHKPLQVRAVPADQMYNRDDQILRTACSCGKTTGIKPGNRHAAEW